MNTVELVKQICKEKGISIHQLEMGCGFGNGYIRGLREGKLPSNRLKIIADYLDVSTDYLISEKEERLDAENAHLVSKIRADMDLVNALKKYFDLSDTKKKLILDMIESLSGNGE